MVQMQRKNSRKVPPIGGSLAEACTLLRWCKCRVKVMYKSVHT